MYNTYNIIAMYRRKTMKFAQSSNNLSSFWDCLELLGINVLKDSGEYKDSFRMKIYNLFMIFVLLLSFAVVSAVLVSIPLKIYTVLQIMQIILVQFMYFSILKSKSQLSIVRKLMNLLPLHKTLNPCLIIMYILIRLSICIMLFYPVYESLNNFRTLHAFNVNATAWFSVIFLISYHLLVLVTPIILNSMFCAISYQWKETIIYVKRDLETANFTDFHRKQNARNLLSNCRLLWKGTSIIKNTFSTFLFYVIMKNIFVIFLLPYTAIVKGMELEEYTVSIFFSLGIELFYFLSTVYLASTIPEEMDNLSMVLKQLYEEISLIEKDEKLRFTKKQMELIINKKPIVLTAGGWADMRKSFILSTFGNLITYGLIVIQYNPLN